MTLRDQCVEAAAVRLWQKEYGRDSYPPRDSEAETEFNVHTLPAAAAALDAILDTLEANAEKWEGVAVAELGSEAYLHVAEDLRPFIQALRNPNVEEETRG